MCCTKYFAKSFLYYQQGNKSLTHRPDMTLAVYRGRKTTLQPTNQQNIKKTGIAQKHILPATL